MDIFDNNLLNQPKDDQFLWRYIKKERINDFLNGNIYFAKLRQFDDYHEGITPLHLMLLHHIKRSTPWSYELDQSIQKLESSDTYQNRLRAYTDNFLLDYETKLLNSNLAQLLEENDPEKLKIILQEKINDFTAIQNQHLENQQKTIVSCWFVGDDIESAPMWNSYSAPDGIAVFIPFKHFKKTISNFFSQYYKYGGLEEIKTVNTGLVQYHRYYLTNEWLNEIKKGIPLEFFKHLSYKNEQEYRIVLKTDNKDLDQLYTLFPLNDQFQIILHPCATHKDMDKIRSLVDKKFHVKFSELSYNIK